VDINVFIFSIIFLHIPTSNQNKISFGFHNYRSVQISVILSNLKIKKSSEIIL